MAPPPNAEAPVDRNQLALVSFWLSLAFLAVVLLNVATFGLVVSPLVDVLLLSLAGVLDIPSVVLLFVAIVTGHVALHRAKRYPPHQAQRGLAIASLVLGYVGMALFLAVVGMATWIHIHPIRMHIVF